MERSQRILKIKNSHNLIFAFGLIVVISIAIVQSGAALPQADQPQQLAAAYQPPIGIPAPSFGIDEAHTMYQRQLFDYDGDGTPEAPYNDAGNGPYTHYVDSTHPNCSNSYDYGTAAAPLCDIYKGDLSITLAPGAWELNTLLSKFLNRHSEPLLAKNPSKLYRTESLPIGKTIPCFCAVGMLRRTSA
ncbi:hypothetical protein MNBD_CHLOROFLEXI01-3209 [hydrothermal vent metagenome]|uniref:Uncharacterized protein n=1 Tax=hydrothermal vent metagenome TaxID=652676 RepID=A0A3B0VJ25_9ZZZZ